MKPIITPEEMADRLDRDASTMDVGRPPVQCTRRKAANMIRQMSLDIAVLRGKGNVWQEAVDHQRVITHLGIANDIATQEEAHKALNEVITWHVNVAIDPAVNGGFSLQPVKPTPAAEPLPLLVRDIARDLGITTLDACQALKGLGNFSVNSAVTADMARKLRECFPESIAEPAAVAVPAVLDTFSGCAIADSNYAAGMLLGWNLCVTDDSETFSRIRSDRMSAAIQASRAARATPGPAR